MASDHCAEPVPLSSETLTLANAEAVHADDAPFPTDAEAQEWETKAQAWLSSMPVGRDVMVSEIDSWIDSDPSSVPETLKSLPRSSLHHRILSLQKIMHNTSEIKNSNQDDPPRPRFVRTDQWIPVYSWLESLEANEVVKSKDISEWLSENPKVKDQLYARHSRYHLMHYIQKLHLKMLRKREKLKKGTQHIQPSIARTSLPIRIIDNGEVTAEDPFAGKFSSNLSKDNEMYSSRKNEARLRYELFTELQDQLSALLARHRNVNRLTESSLPGLSSQQSAENIGHQVPVTVKEEGNINATTGSTSPLDSNSDKKRKRIDEVVTPAWSCSEASADTLLPLSLRCEEAKKQSVWKEKSRSLFKGYRQNIYTCLEGRERGFSWPVACSRGSYAGRHQEKWIPFLQGWKSLGRRFLGPGVYFECKSCLSWIPTWCAYTSSVAIAQPFGRLEQGVQKVLDVRFHPEGLAQLVCSSNEGPNELLLYNLLTGRATELAGHNCQVQAVEYAVKGASVVSCGGTTVKVWDSTTGSCLYTLGTTSSGQASVGHRKKINAMSVNHWQSWLVVTSGGEGDGKLLLWNVLTGELAADLNINERARKQGLPWIDAMEFCSQNLLVCGSDCAYGSQGLLQLWDIEAPRRLLSFPAHDSYITSLKINPTHDIIITGAGDGTVGLFDVRSGGVISHLSVGSGYEVTSVSFSNCGNYLHASSTSNNTLVWDTRLLPMSPSGQYNSVCDSRSMRALHCLSHGKPMPTAEHAGQLPGYVDDGDQGVNDARWLHREPVLVTVSGDGSLAMWDVSLGQPCIRHISSHTRCVNSVAVAPNDKYFCSGGDDQKVVLYEDLRRKTHARWRLTHPMG
ncbi:hypothetical protein H6P81_012111 [Aristolochia fimbriata]|uniref:Uncharacterized protein n=1 Tax=Aristolochia fimbriata TaxID=158543 RepID=A0AAV7EFH4_ARIFI|nr:hypothetical protein H6P81_012111 [Aristolochia fimbriata]